MSMKNSAIFKLSEKLTVENNAKWQILVIFLYERVLSTRHVKM